MALPAGLGSWQGAGVGLFLTSATGNLYDLAGRPIALIDPNGRRTTTVYDAAGQTVREMRVGPSGWREKSRIEAERDGLCVFG